MGTPVQSDFPSPLAQAVILPAAVVADGAPCRHTLHDVTRSTPSHAPRRHRYDHLLPAGKKIYVEWSNECFFGNNACYDDDEQLANITVMEHGDPYRLNQGLGPVNLTKSLTTWGSRMYAWTCLRMAQLAARVVGQAKVRCTFTSVGT